MQPDQGRVARQVLVGALAVATVLAIVVMTGFATRTDRLPLAASLAVALLGILVSLRWPLVPLFAFAVLIPFEEALVIEGVGTLTRYAGILFIVAYGVPRLGRLAIPAMPLAGWGYLAWAIFSAAWAIDSPAAWVQLPVLILLFAVALLITVAVVDRPSIVRPLLWAYTLATSVTAVIGIAAYVIGGSPGGPNDRTAAIADQNPAYFAALLLPALVFGLYELVNGRAVLMSAAVTFVCSAAIIASGTRGAWVAAAVVVLLFVLPSLPPARRIGAMWVVAAMLLITMQLPGVATLVEQRTDIALSTGGSGRTDIWTVGLRIFSSAPLNGVGYANFAIAFTQDLVRDTPIDVLDAANAANRAPHNIVVGTLGELGLVGTALLALFVGPLILRRGWGQEAAAVQAALASLFILALFLDIMNRKQVWLLIGIACGLAYLARSTRVRSAVGALAWPQSHSQVGDG